MYWDVATHLKRGWRMNNWFRQYQPKRSTRIISIVNRHWQRMRRSWAVQAIILVTMLVVLIFAILYSIRVGSADVSNDLIISATFDHLSEKFDLGWTSDLDYTDRTVLIQSKLIVNIRWARVIMAGIVGGGLAISGTALQGVFRNPLADSSLIGVSGGASLGAVAAIAFGIEFTLWGYEVGVAGTAFTAGVLATLLVYSLAYQQRHTNTSTMLLIGVGINAIATAFIGLMSFRIGQEKVGDIIFWTLGSLAEGDWTAVEITLPFTLIGAIILIFTARALNVLALGEAEAGYLGVPVQQLRLIVVFIAALLTAIGVSFVGIIGLVGLVIPHVLRMLLGPDYRLLLPASFLGGATFLIGMDIWARTIAEPTEVPIGIMTTLIGGPFFLLIILLNQRRGRQI